MRSVRERLTEPPEQKRYDKGLTGFWQLEMEAERILKAWFLVVPADGKAELRMKSRWTLSGPTAPVQPPLPNVQLPRFHFERADFDTVCRERVHPSAAVDGRRSRRVSPKACGHIATGTQTEPPHRGILARHVNLN